MDNSDSASTAELLELMSIYDLGTVISKDTVLMLNGQISRQFPFAHGDIIDEARNAAKAEYMDMHSVDRDDSTLTYLVRHAFGENDIDDRCLPLAYFPIPKHTFYMVKVGRKRVCLTASSGRLSMHCDEIPDEAKPRRPNNHRSKSAPWGDSTVLCRNGFDIDICKYDSSQPRFSLGTFDHQDSVALRYILGLNPQNAKGRTHPAILHPTNPARICLLNWCRRHKGLVTKAVNQRGGGADWAVWAQSEIDNPKPIDNSVIPSEIELLHFERFCLSPASLLKNIDHSFFGLTDSSGIVVWYCSRRSIIRTQIDYHFTTYQTLEFEGIKFAIGDCDGKPVAIMDEKRIIQWYMYSGAHLAEYPDQEDLYLF